jgi:hypothetical protein
MREKTRESNLNANANQASAFLFQWEIVCFIASCRCIQLWDEALPLINLFLILITEMACAHFAEGCISYYERAHTLHSIVSLKISRWSAVEWKCANLQCTSACCVHNEVSMLPPQWFWFNYSCATSLAHSNASDRLLTTLEGCSYM